MKSLKANTKSLGILESVAVYLAIISSLLLIKYYSAPKWKLFIDQSARLATISITMVTSSLFLLSVQKRRILSLFKTEAARYGILFLAVAFGLYFKFHGYELIVFLYTVYAVLFIRSTLETNSLHKPAHTILDAILDAESRTPAIFALLLLILLPFLVILKETSTAESIAVYVYYFLTITVILQIIEVRQGIEKENRFLKLITGTYRIMYQNLQDQNDRIQLLNSLKKLGRQIFSRRLVAHMVIFLTISVGIYIVKEVYWKRVMLTVSSNPEYRSDLALSVGDTGFYTFPSYADDIIVPIKVRHPLSNPLWWPESGVGAVSIGIEWYSLDDATRRIKIFEDSQPIPRPLFINDSSEVSVKLKRPFIVPERTYEVMIGLVSGGKMRFSEKGDNPLKLQVRLERPSGYRSIEYERSVQERMRDAVQEQMGVQLASSADDYRSKIEIMQDALLTPTSTQRISVTNRGRLPWPAYNKHAVKLGVAWVQKNLDGVGPPFVHLAEETYPLPRVILPGDRAFIDVTINPQKAPEADEIWIGMVHEGETWFYKKGDAVIKLPNRNIQFAQQLADLQRGNEALERKLKALGGKITVQPVWGEGEAVVRDDAYRSKIRLIDDESRDRVMTVANRLPLDLELTNTGDIPWNPSDDDPVNLGILWFKKTDNVTFMSPRIFEERCIFPYNVLKDVTLRMQCMIGDKVLPGSYEVWIGLVHDHVTWFYEKGDQVLKLNVTVK